MRKFFLFFFVEKIDSKKALIYGSVEMERARDNSEWKIVYEYGLYEGSKAFMQWKIYLTLNSTMNPI